MVYRGVFNPLNRFPGPFLARFTDFWLGFHVGKSLDQYRKLNELHRKYGKIVRTGATHLSISDSTFVEPVLGFGSVASKGAWYDIDYPYHSIHEERDVAVHERKRGLWAPAFSDKALRSYNVQLNAVNDRFMEKIAELEDTPLDVTRWFSIYMFDAMRAVVFGRLDGLLLDSGDSPKVFEAMGQGMAILGLALPMWFIRVLKLLPGNPMAPFHAFTDQQLEQAVRSNFPKNKNTDPMGRPSIVTWLYKIYEHEADAATHPLFRVDARLLMAAGSETAAAAFTFLFYLLAKHPEHVAIIRKEIQACVQDQSAWSDITIKSCQHLNGSILESMRLHPPGPSGVYRLTPPQGLRVGTTFIPGNTNIQLPVYVLHRDPAAFAQPLEFIPERWYDRPALIHDRTAYAPFAKGPYQCIGKSLAMLELRCLTAKILLGYDVSLAPGEDGSRLLFESKDHFSMTLAPLDLVFTRAR